MELLKKYQAVILQRMTVLAALKKHVLPIFDPSSSVVVAVTAPSKADPIGKDLTDAGYEVELRTLEFDPGELEVAFRRGVAIVIVIVIVMVNVVSDNSCSPQRTFCINQCLPNVSSTLHNSILRRLIYADTWHLKLARFLFGRLQNPAICWCLQ